MPDPDIKSITLADVAKKVARTVTQNGRVKKEPVDPSEILSWRDYGTHIVVVTIDGQKLSSRDGK